MAWPSHPALLLLGLLGGIALIYLEANHPGRIVPGCVGLLLALLSIWRLSKLALEPGAVLVALAGYAICFLHPWMPLKWLATVLGAFTMTAGFVTLTAPPVVAISHPVAVLLAFPFAFLTSYLMSIAVEASRAKRRSTPPAIH